MSYDFTGTDRSPPVVSPFRANPRDLEAIVTSLELAAIDLSPTDGATFTREELVAKAQQITGLELVAIDVAIVLPMCRFLDRVGKLMRLR